MSAATATPTPATKGQSPQSAALSKITNVPVVAKSLTFAHSTITSTQLGAQGYQLGESVFNSSLKAAEPITVRIQPQLALVDAWAVKGLDFAESKWAYPFTASPEKIYADAKSTPDQARNLVASYTELLQQAYEARVAAPAKGLYDARVAPVYDQAAAQFQELKSQNAYLARATDIVQNLQSNLSATVEKISGLTKAEGDAATRKAQGISNALFAELERVRSFAASLPAESRKRVAPVLDTFSETYARLNKEARDSSVSPVTRFQNVIKFVQEQTLPALQKAVIHPESSAPVVNGTQ